MKIEKRTIYTIGNGREFDNDVDAAEAEYELAYDHLVRRWALAHDVADAHRATARPGGLRPMNSRDPFDLSERVLADYVDRMLDPPEPSGEEQSPAERIDAIARRVDELLGDEDRLAELIVDVNDITLIAPHLAAAFREWPARYEYLHAMLYAIELAAVEHVKRMMDDHHE